MASHVRKLLPWLLVPASLLIFIILVELLSMAWLRSGGKPRQAYLQKPPTAFFPWKEVERLSREDKGQKGKTARELVNLGILNFETRPAKRDLSLLSEPGDYSELRGKIATPGLDEEIILRGVKTKRVKAKYRVRIDEHYRRSSGLPVSSEKENIVFLGCSYTFGDSINTEDTIPHLVAKEFPLNSYNLGFPGGSAVKTYVALVEEGKKYLGDLNGKPVNMIYTFIDDQMRRTIGTSRWLSSGKGLAKSGHQVYLSGDELHYYKRKDADFFDFLWFRTLFGISSFARAFSLELPFIGEDELELFARTILGIKEAASKLVPLKTFLFVFYPGENFYAPRLIPHLKKHGIQYLDLSDISPGLLNGHETVPGDLHPSGDLNRVFVHFLSLELRRASGYP